MTEKQFVPLTAEQLASAEKGDLKLEYRGGGKVMQLVWFKEPYDRIIALVSTIDENGHIHHHPTCGGDTGCPMRFDLFVCEEQPVKYGGQLTGVPVEIVEFMLDQQEAQGNERDASVFEACFAQNKPFGGFDWWRTSADSELQKAGNMNYEPMLEYLRKLKGDEGHK